MSKQRYYIVPGTTTKPYDLAIATALNLAGSNQGIKEIVFLTDTLPNKKPVESLYALADANSVRQGITRDHFILRHDAITTFVESSIDGKRVMIVFAPDDDYLVYADSYRTVSHLIVIPIDAGRNKEWIRRWHPHEIQDGLVVENSFDIKDPSIVVCKALDELSITGNASSRRYSLDDRIRAKTYARTLFKFEPGLNADDIEGYLLHKKAWPTVHAKSFADLIRTLLDGSHFRGGAITGLAAHYKRWVESCGVKVDGEIHQQLLDK